MTAGDVVAFFDTSIVSAPSATGDGDVMSSSRRVFALTRAAQRSEIRHSRRCRIVRQCSSSSASDPPIPIGPAARQMDLAMRMTTV